MYLSLRYDLFDNIEDSCYIPIILNKLVSLSWFAIILSFFDNDKFNIFII